MDIHKIQTLFQNRSVKWSTHCLERMQERDILRDDVISCVLRGEIIEDYPNDFPYPSCLIFGYTRGCLKNKYCTTESDVQK